MSQKNGKNIGLSYNYFCFLWVCCVNTSLRSKKSPLSRHIKIPFCKCSDNHNIFYNLLSNQFCHIKYKLFNYKRYFITQR